MRNDRTTLLLADLIFELDDSLSAESIDGEDPFFTMPVNPVFFGLENTLPTLVLLSHNGSIGPARQEMLKPFVHALTGSPELSGLALLTSGERNGFTSHIEHEIIQRGCGPALSAALLPAQMKSVWAPKGGTTQIYRHIAGYHDYAFFVEKNIPGFTLALVHAMAGSLPVIGVLFDADERTLQQALALCLAGHPLYVMVGSGKYPDALYDLSMDQEVLYASNESLLLSILRTTMVKFASVTESSIAVQNILFALEGSHA